MKYTYDDFDRITGVKYDSETANRYTYGYGSNGQAAEVKDTNLSRITRTEFDLSDRPCKVEVTDLNDNLVYRTQLKYDKRSNLHSFSEKLPSETHTTTYTYDNDNRITNIAYDGTTNKVAYTYDSLGRVNTRAANSYTTTFGYIAGGHGTKSTTPLVASITQPGMNFSYTYDNRGNITSETRNGSTTTYVYDGLGQLVRVNDPHENATWVYNYDRGGNITSKVKYAYTTGTLGTAQQTIYYTYGDTNWKDKLTAYSGTAITYDAIGNPTNDGTWNYVWSVGRQLKQMSKSGTTITFKYNHNGLRTQKAVTVNGVTTTTNYTYHGKLVTHMTKGSDTLHFFYDSNSSPAFVKFNGTMYRYIHNLQGDIVGIIDSNNTLVVEYKYDAWGKPISTIGNMAGTLGTLNPFRYRGYVYDTEMSLYYLRSRYYKAQCGNFLNSDIILGDYNILSQNAFAYCRNTPVMFADRNGLLPHVTPEPTIQPLPSVRPIPSVDFHGAPEDYGGDFNISECGFISWFKNIKKNITSFMKRTFGSAIYLEVDKNQSRKTIAGGIVSGQNISTIISGTRTNNPIISYIKMSTEGINFGVSIENFSIEGGSNGLTISGGSASESIYMNISDHIYWGSSINKTDGNATIASYNEEYFDPLTLVLVAVSIFGGNVNIPYSVGFAF